MIDFKAGLEKYIEAEVQRRVEARLAKVLEQLGVPRHGGRRSRVQVSAATASAVRPPKARRPVSVETRAKMKAAWARRKAEQQAPRAGDQGDPGSTGK
jgi:hypothetical protein